MSARGPYAKGLAKRAEILDVALVVVDREGYSGATVKHLAEAVGLSQNGLLHYFGSKEALFTEILRHHDARTVVSVDPTHTDFATDLLERILFAMDEESSSPGMTQLLLRLTGEATEPTHAAHDFLRVRYDAVRTVLVTALEERRRRGTLADDIDPEATAALVFAAWDGLRTQRLYDPRIDMRSQMIYLLDRLGILA